MSDAQQLSDPVKNKYYTTDPHSCRVQVTFLNKPLKKIKKYIYNLCVLCHNKQAYTLHGTG